MPHDRLTEPRYYRSHSMTRREIDANIRRAHQLRSKAVGDFFGTLLGRRHRAAPAMPTANCATC